MNRSSIVCIFFYKKKDIFVLHFMCITENISAVGDLDLRHISDGLLILSAFLKQEKFSFLFFISPQKW